MPLESEHREGKSHLFNEAVIPKLDKAEDI